MITRANITCCYGLVLATNVWKLLGLKRFKDIIFYD